ncbi:MAG: efflux RND transporter periplasmic adaptor subunit [Deltaproteobacteria bacterium]|nr:efflux RND transporter periplasmic adaptor subunit [Deltaproteobacteria bacterium]
MTLSKPWNGLLISLVMLPLVTLGGCDDSSPSVAPPTDPEERILEVETLELLPQSVTDLASLPADLLPLRRAELAAEVSGSVDRLRVKEGDRVVAGQALASIDTRALQQQVAEAEAVNRRAEARHQRASRLFEKQSITQQQLLDAITDRDVAQARLASAQLQLDKSTVRAPWAGQVNTRHIEVGDFVAPGQPVFELIDASRMKVRAPAPAADVPFLENGAAVTLRLDNSQQPPVSGKIVRLAAELDRSSRTLDVEAEIPNPRGTLKPGMYGRLEVVRQTLPAAILAPLDALLDLGGRSAVFVVRDGQARRVEIDTGPVIGENVVVEAGLKSGDRIVISGQAQLGDGQRVTESRAGQEKSSP